MARNKCIVGQPKLAVWAVLLLTAVPMSAVAAGGTASGTGSSGGFNPSFKQITDICVGPIPSTGPEQNSYYTLDKDKFLRAIAAQSPAVALDIFQHMPGSSAGQGTAAAADFGSSDWLKKNLWDKIAPPTHQDSSPGPAAISSPAEETPLTTAYSSIKQYLQNTPLVRRNQQNLDTVNFFITGEEKFSIRYKDGVKFIEPSLYNALTILLGPKGSQTPTVYCGTPYPSPQAVKRSPRAMPPTPTSTAATQQDTPQLQFAIVPAANAPDGGGTRLTSDQAAPSKSSYFANSISSKFSTVLAPIRARSAGTFMVKGSDFSPNKADANDPSADSYVYSSDKGLSINMQQTASNARQLSNFTGALGIDLVTAYDKALNIQPDESFAVVPFLAANRTQAAGKVSASTSKPLPTLTNNTQDWGGVFGVKISLGSTDTTEDNQSANVKDPPYLIVRLIYDNETDNLLHNKFGTTEARISPYWNSMLPINEYCLRVGDSCRLLSGLPDIRGEIFAGNVRALTIVDFRAKYIDYYAVENIGAKSVDPRLFSNAMRLGGEIGEALAFNFVPNYPLTISYTYTDYLGLTGFHKDMGLAEYTASLTLNSALPTAPMISFSFDHGRRDDTTVPYLAWILSFSMKL